jgi:hypothetical protein
MVVFNLAAFLIALISVFVSLAASYVFGWLSFKQNIDSAHEDYAILLGATLMFALDLALRLKNWQAPLPPQRSAVVDPNLPPPPQPNAAMNLLNVLLSGTRGGQFFWIIPAWLLAILVIPAAFTK